MASNVSDQPLPRQYFFRKLRSRIYTLCFFDKTLDHAGIKEQVQFRLIKALFFGDGNFKNKFIHFTNTQTEISIFLDKNSRDKFLHDMPPEMKQYLNMDQTCFRAAEMYSLQNDLHFPGVTSFISGKLAARDIPIIYCNSFNSSFILVPESHFAAACAIFKAIADPEMDKDDEPDDV